MHNLTQLTILPNGNLNFRLTDEGRAHYIDNNEADAAHPMLCDEDFFLDYIEPYWCNGYSIVRPEDIGALTDSLLISDSGQDDNGKYPDDMKVWYFNDYMLVSYMDALGSDEGITFTLA